MDFVGKVMSLLFNMLSRVVITFLPRSKCLLISWLQSPSAVVLEPRKIKSATVSPSICHEVMGPDANIFIFWMLSFKSTFYFLFHFHQEAFEFLFTFYHKGGIICISRRRQWHPTPGLLPGKSHGRRSLVGCRLWGHRESDTAEST